MELSQLMLYIMKLTGKLGNDIGLYDREFVSHAKEPNAGARHDVAVTFYTILITISGLIPSRVKPTTLK